MHNLHIKVNPSIMVEYNTGELLYRQYVDML